MKKERLEWLYEHIDYEQIAQDLEKGMDRSIEVVVVYPDKGELILDIFYDLELDYTEGGVLLTAYLYLHDCNVFWREEGESMAEDITHKIDIDENELEEAIVNFYRQ